MSGDEMSASESKLAQTLVRYPGATDRIVEWFERYLCSSPLLVRSDPGLDGQRP